MTRPGVLASRKAVERMPAAKRLTPETALKQVCIRMLALQGWASWAIPASNYGKNGLPDRIAIKDGCHVWLEFKAGKRQLTQPQIARIAELEAAGAKVLVVRSVEDVMGLGEASLE